MEEKAIIVFKAHKKNLIVDIEVPLDISGNDLVHALNEAYSLGIDTKNILNCYLKSENPIALLKGSKTLAEYGIYNGSIIHFTE